MGRGMGWAVAVLVAMGIAGGAEAADITECTSKNKKPTFVWHESEAPTMYYVEPGGTFTPMASARQAQEVCLSRGVRQRLRGRDCTTVGWDYFACGCNVSPPTNRTCDRFQRFLGVMER
ncbi:hypothetical protein [uncultured Rhodospira sp.]|uniref:hypothetical protein n=1 Tax=uncultured Rhodospira sp. TaxID=1936189 RepID=UPI002602F528|nr:hypothetical protein [uncultured Rhodospira sp.]